MVAGVKGRAPSLRMIQTVCVLASKGHGPTDSTCRCCPREAIAQGLRSNFELQPVLQSNVPFTYMDRSPWYCTDACTSVSGTARPERWSEMDCRGAPKPSHGSGATEPLPPQPGLSVQTSNLSLLPTEHTPRGPHMALMNRISVPRTWCKCTAMIT